MWVWACEIYKSSKDTFIIYISWGFLYTFWYTKDSWQHLLNYLPSKNRQRNYAVSFIDPKTLIFRTITGKKITVETKWLYYGSSSYLVPYMAELLIHMLKRWKPMRKLNMIPHRCLFPPRLTLNIVLGTWIFIWGFGCICYGNHIPKLSGSK